MALVVLALAVTAAVVLTHCSQPAEALAPLQA
jgi:hypothetical protein